MHMTAMAFSGATRYDSNINRDSNQCKRCASVSEIFRKSSQKACKLAEALSWS